MKKESENWDTEPQMGESHVEYKQGWASVATSHGTAVISGSHQG